MFGKKKPMTQEARPANDITGMSYLELKALRETIDASIASQYEQARENFQRDFLDKMADFNLKIEDFAKKQKKERKKREVKVKYQDPDNPENSWTGMGKPKRWLKEKLDQGHALETFLIEKQANGTM